MVSRRAPPSPNTTHANLNDGMARSAVHSRIVGSFVAVIVHFCVMGIQMCLCYLTVHAYIDSAPQGSAQSRARLVFLISSLLIAALFTIHSVRRTSMLSAIMQTRSSGGDLDTFLIENFEMGAEWLNSATQVMVNSIGNGILIYRCYIFYAENLWLIILPGLLEAAAIAVAIPAVISMASLKIFVDIGYKTVLSLSAAYVLLSLSCNLIVTCLIIFKIVRVTREVTSLLQISPMRKHKSHEENMLLRAIRSRNTMRWTETRRRLGKYTSIIAVLIESCLPLALIGVIDAALNRINHDWMDLTGAIWFSLCALSPQLVIFRVMSNQAWKKNTEATILSAAWRSGIFDELEVGSTALMDMNIAQNSTTVEPDSQEGDAPCYIKMVEVSTHHDRRSSFVEYMRLNLDRIIPVESSSLEQY